MFLRPLRRALLGIVLATVLAAPGSAGALGLASGDLVVYFVKNGFELILNTGAVPPAGGGRFLEESTLALPAQFNGSLDGAIWGAFSVRAPDRTFSEPELLGAPQSNLILTTGGDPASVSFAQVADAQAQLQPANQGIAWFALLRSIGAANGTTILENTVDRAVIGASLFASYTLNLGLGTNAVGNTLPLSTIRTISAPGGSAAGNEIPLYELLQRITIDAASGELTLGAQVVPLGPLRIVPEPGTALLLVAGLAGLVRYGRRPAR